MIRIGNVLTLTFLLAAAGCSGPEEPPPPPAPEAVALIGATVLTGSGEVVRDGGLLIKEGRIEMVGPTAALPLTNNTTVVDLTGKFVTPGLVDVHCHYNGDRKAIERLMRWQLYYGVTTARSAGGDDEEALEVIRDAQARRIPAPRMYTAGLGFTHPDGHPVSYTHINRPATTAEARKQVGRLAEWKVDFVKMWVDDKYGRIPKISAEMRTAVVDEALKKGLRPMAHIFEAADLRQLVAAGARDFLHTVRDPIMPDESLFALCREKGVTFAPTLSIIESNWLLPENPLVLETDEILGRTVIGETRTAMLDDDARAEAAANPDIAMLKQELEVAKRFAKRAFDAGVPIAVGSDSGTNLVPAGWGTLHELDLLAEAGLSAEEVVAAATATGASLLPERGTPFGTLAAGHAADLLVLTSDPRESTGAFRTVERVMQSGLWVDRAQLLKQQRSSATAAE